MLIFPVFIALPFALSAHPISARRKPRMKYLPVQFAVALAVSTLVRAQNTITAPPTGPTPPPREKRQTIDTAALNSAQSFYQSCANSCTDAVQSAIQSSRLAVDSKDQFCDDFGDKPGDSLCFCGNFVVDSTDIGSSVSSCASASCTGVPSDIQTFIGFPDDFMTTYLADLSSVECNPIQFPAQANTGSVQPTTGGTSSSASSSAGSESSTSAGASSTPSAGSSTRATSATSGSSSSASASASASTSNNAGHRAMVGVSVSTTHFSNPRELAVLFVLATPVLAAFVRALL